MEMLHKNSAFAVQMPNESKNLYTVCDKTSWRHTTQWLVTENMQLVKFDKNSIRQIHA